MIKFFRKIRYQLMSENKTGKYVKYAIGEILLVVIGILIALQVNNWNESRQKRLKEKTVLTAIHKEFSENKKQLDTVVSYHSMAKQSCEKLIAMFPIDVKTNNLDSIGKHVYNTLSHYTFNPANGSFKGLINTSSLDVISNNELREILVSWNDLVLDYQEDEEVGKSIVQNHLDPLFAKNIDFNMNFDDERNKLDMLESLEFEYNIKLRLLSLNDILEGYEFDQLENSLNRIIELTSSQSE